MPRSCIICGDAANSREHIFPAALGGLRVNRGIYCEQHNNGFSGLADVLSRQLGMWNALLGVRDRDRRPRVLQVTTPEGEEVVVTAGRAQRVNAGPVHPEGGIHLQLTLGGPEGLPAIAYVALTFFAHHFGDIARQESLAPIKAFIRRQGENQFVWWESDTTTRGLPTNPFAFGHTIILTTSAGTGEARALISLFQTLTFGIALGHVSEVIDRTVTVFVDPHADRQPLDTQERRSNTIEVRIEPPQPMHAHLERMVYRGDGQDLMQRLMARIERWHFENEMGPVLVRLNAARDLPVGKRLREIQRIVAEEAAGRVHRLMRHVVRELRPRIEAQPEMSPVSAALAAQVALNNARDNISDDAHLSVARVLVSFIGELNSRLEQQPVDMEYLWMLFSGGPGMHLATQTMVDPIMIAIGAPQNWAKVSGE